jgi:hypothetical protein
MFLDLHLPSTLQYRVSRQFTHIGRRKLVDLRSTRVFLKKMRGGEMELKGIV